jgi:signal transduction histidine kinase
VALENDLAKRLDGGRIRYAVIDVATGKVIAGSAPSIAAMLPSLPPGARHMAFAVAIPESGRQASLAGFVVERTDAVPPVRVAVANEERHHWPFIAWAIDELVGEVLPVGIPLFLATLLVTAVTIRHTLRPVARLSAQAGAITPRTTGLRLESRKVPQEVQPLVESFNAALERLDEGFALQRRFTANAAHQLRTPLAILRARLDGLPARPEVELLKRDCDRIARVVTQLLAISRLEARQIELTETVELVGLAESIVADMAPLAIGGGRSLSLDAPAMPVLAHGNSAALRDALLNLIDNALRYGPAGEAVEVVVRPGASLAVADRGPGVPSEDRLHVFEPFWRGRDNADSGSGLGLAIVQEIAAAHGGRASAAPRPGGGAVFRIDLPEAASAGPAQLAAQ